VEKILIILILILASIISVPPAYANVVDPITGLSTCDLIQMEIDRGEKNEWITDVILENINDVKNGQLEIIDSDCIFLVDIDDYLGDDEDLIIGNLVNLTSRYDGVYEATIYFQDYREPNRIPGGVMTATFEIRDGIIHGDNPYLRGAVVSDGGVSMELQFAGGECYPWGEMELTNKLSAESSCTYGDMRIEAQKIGDLGPKELRSSPFGEFEVIITIVFLTLVFSPVVAVPIGIRSLNRAKKEHRKSIKGYILLGIGIVWPLMLVSSYAFFN